MAKNKRHSMTDFDESLIDNTSTYWQYFYRLCELSMSMFEWKNIPDTVDTRFLELTLFRDGRAIFFEDEVLGYLTLQCTIYGKWNVYRIPQQRTAYSVGQYRKKLTADDSVVIFNNFMRTNSMLDVRMFAKRLYDLDRAIDVNANAQKTPIIIKCKESQRLTMENIRAQVEGNMPYIFVDADEYDDRNFKVFNTSAPYVADRLYQLKTQIWNEALTYLGISNINVVKKERLITDEVTRNQGGTVASRYSRLEARRQACEMINKMFGLDIWCDYREDYREIDYSLDGKGEDGTNTEEGEINE